MVKLGKINVGPYHLSHILSGEDAWNLDDSLSYAQLFSVKMLDDYFMENVHFLSTGMAPSDMTITKKKQMVVKEENYQLIVGNLYNLGANGILRRCVLEHERPMILIEVYKRIARGNYVGKVTA
jgi:hypothetical protein